MSDALNPFDPARLRLDPSSLADGGAKKLLNNIAVRKPNRQEFVRVNPDPAYRVTPAALIELKEDRETYLVPPGIASELAGECFTATIFTAMSRQNVLFLWVVKLTGSEGRAKANAWHDSAARAATCAMTQWVRVTANMHAGYYETFAAEATIPPPEWPNLSMADLLQIAFRDKLIDSTDHAIIQYLRGAA